jgi:hypothetical protein
MTTMRWLSLSLFCIGSLGLVGSVDAEAQGKRNKKPKPAVEEPAVEEVAADVTKEEQLQESADLMEEEPRDGAAGYDDGFYIRDGGDSPNRLTINGRVQPRFSFFSAEGGDERINSHNFSVPAARLAVHGNVYDDRVYFKTQIAMEQGRTDLKDFFLDYRIGKKQTRIRLGQFKKQFSRQFESSGYELQFTGRSIVDPYFDNGRDIGVQLHSGFVDEAELEWSFGVFNGNGSDGVFQPTTTIDPVTMEEVVSGGQFSNIPRKVRPAVVARLGYNANEIDGYTESDLEGGDLRYALAVATMTHFRLGGNTAVSRNGVDFAVKQDGYSATGGIYAEMRGPKAADLEYTGLGGYIQTGYVIDKTYEPALRYAVITEDGGDSVQEITGVLNIYKFGHNMKWQNEATLLNTDVSTVRSKDLRFISQAHLVF